MKNQLFTFCIVIVFLSCNCKKEFIQTNNKYLWKSPLNADKNFNGGYISFNEFPILKKTYLIAGYVKNKNKYFKCINIINGKEEWNLAYPESNNLGLSKFIFNDHYMIYTSPRNLYKLNFDAVQHDFIGKLPFVEDLPDIIGEGSYIFKILANENTTNTNSNFFLYQIFPYNNYQGKIIDFLNQNVANRTPHFYINDQKDTCLLLDYAFGRTSISSSKAYVALINLNHNKIIYRDQEYANIGGGARTGILQGDKFYSISTQRVICINVMNGNVLWSSIDMVEEAPDKILYYNNKLYVSRTSGNMLVFDANTGNKLFEIDANGITSALKILNGVLYWVDLGSGHLRAADAETGVRLWDIISPDEASEGSQFYFSTQIGVAEGQNGQKGKIIVSTYLNAYCYEAIR